MIFLKTNKNMKKRNVMALAIILASFGSVNAKVNKTILDENPASKITIKQLQNLKFKVMVSEESKDVALVKITDERGNEIYSEKINATKLKSKLYDLSNLTDGTYTFAISSGKVIEKQKIYISTQINRSALMALN